MFEYVDLNQFTNYLREHYKGDPLLPILEGGGIKAVLEEGQYRLVFTDNNTQAKAKFYCHSKINKLFGLVLNGTFNVELIWDEDGKYDNEEDKKQREIIRQAEEKERKEQHIRTINWLFEQSLIPQVKRSSFTFDNYKTIAENNKSFELLKKYQAGFLTLCGATGLGKTHLAVAIGQKYIEQELTVFYYQVEKLLDMLRHTFDKDGNGYDNKMNQLEDCDLLILDDFGTQKNTDWVITKLDTIIDSRYINEKSTIITSNLSLKAIGESSERIASRLSSGLIVTLVGTDYRASHKTQIDTIPPPKDINKFTQGKYGHLVQR